MEKHNVWCFPIYTPTPIPLREILQGRLLKCLPYTHLSLRPMPMRLGGLWQDILKRESVIQLFTAGNSTRESHLFGMWFKSASSWLWASMERGWALAERAWLSWLLGLPPQPLSDLIIPSNQENINKRIQNLAKCHITFIKSVIMSTFVTRMP